MKYIIYIFGIMTSVWLQACSGEDDLTPSSVDRNWWVNVDNQDNSLDHLIYEIFEQYKVPIFYNDTIGMENRGKDAFGNPNIYYEVIKLNYTILGGLSDSPLAIYSLSHDYEDIKNGVELLRDYVLSKLPDNIPAPKSYLLVDTLWQGLATGQTRYSSTAYAGMTAVAVGRLSEIKSMSETEKLLFGGEILAAPIASMIYTDCTAELNESFYKVLTKDVNEFYYYGQKVDAANTSVYNPFYLPCENYGFLKPAQDKQIVDGKFYYFPSKEQDVKDYVALYLGFTEEQLQETYGDKPHVLKKYGIIKGIIEKIKAK